MYQRYYSNQDDRIVGGFIGPFLLGGIAGGLAAPYFYRPYRPYYNNYYYGYYNPYPYYPYRPYR